MEKLFFIVNPVSGGGRGKAAFLEAEQLLREKGVPYEAVYSEHPGHAVELARTAAERGERCIIAVGGDGTVNEVASAIHDTGVKMGVLPFGTGNDLARAANFPTDIPQAVETLIKGHTRPMDAGMANDRFFLNVAGFGFDADVLENTTRFKGRFHGMIPYLMGVVTTLSHLRHMKLTFTHDGKTESRGSVLVSVGNGQFIGGGMHALPKADPYDGLFDVIIIRDINVLQLIRLLPVFIKGKHLDYPVVEYFRTAEFTVSAEEPSVLNLDGELGETTPVTFRILPGAIPVIVPEEA